MTAAPRDLRDLLAEACYRARLGLTSYGWDKMPEYAREDQRRLADSAIRWLKDQGVDLVRTGEDMPPLPPPSSKVIYRRPLHDGVSYRQVRKGKGETWELVREADGKEAVEMSFTLAEAQREGNMVLADEPDARKIEGLGRKLAACLEIYRTGAEGLGDG
ncbi:MAG: hypothetical protein K5872_22140 [Rhizobiaceae bacterium]|nr:hypothetical protein [Rhizobiaceae bacterium]MCV0408921.1 hypothetical protein [Rhizobiaceae bacterium]